MSDNQSIYKALQLQALEGKLLSTNDFFERKVRRWFSNSFATPYLKTFEIPWDQILLNYYEANLEKLSHNQALQTLLDSDYVPEIGEHRQKQEEEYDQILETEQKQTLIKKALKDKAFYNKIIAGSDLELKQSLKEAKDEEVSSLSAPNETKEIALSFEDNEKEN